MSEVEEARWVELYARLEKPLYNVVYRVIWDASESQDLVQDTFLRCWKRRKTIEPDRLRAWLFRTAMNLAINRRRRNRLWRFVGLADAAEPSAAQSRCDGGIPAPVRAAIDKLPAGLKHVLLLTEIAGMTYTEVAASLRIKEGTVGSRRTRALALLRDKLQTEGVYRDES